MRHKTYTQNGIFQLTLVLVILLSPVVSLAYELDLGGIRNAALGSTGISSSKDISASVWNPALLARLNRIEVLTDSRKYFWDLDNDEIGYNFATFSYPFGNLGTFAFSGTFAQADRLEEHRLGFHYGKNLWKNKILFGFGLFNYHNGFNLDKYSLNDPFFDEFGTSKDGFDADVGLALFPLKNLSLGFTAQNIRQTNLALDSENKDTLPGIYGMGASYDFNRFTLSTDLKYKSYPNTDLNDLIYASGIEYKLHNNFQLRGGFSKNLASAGFGLKLLEKELINKFHDPVTGREYLQNRTFQVHLDYAVQYPIGTIESSYGDHFFGIKINYENSTTELRKVKGLVPGETKIEYVTKVKLDSLQTNKVKIDSIFYQEKVIIDTVYVEKVVHDTITIVEVVPDSLAMKAAEDLAAMKEKLRNLERVNQAQSYLSEALKLYYQNQFDEAIAKCKSAIQIAPDLTLGYVRLGSIYYRLKKHDLAKFYWEKAIRLDPDHPEVKDIKNHYLNLL